MIAHLPNRFEFKYIIPGAAPGIFEAVFDPAQDSYAVYENDSYIVSISRAEMLRTQAEIELIAPEVPQALLVDQKDGALAVFKVGGGMYAVDLRSLHEITQDRYEELVKGGKWIVNVP